MFGDGQHAQLGHGQNETLRIFLQFCGDLVDEPERITLRRRIRKRRLGVARPARFRPGGSRADENGMSGARQRPDASDRLILVAVEYENVHSLTAFNGKETSWPGTLAQTVPESTSVKRSATDDQ